MLKEKVLNNIKKYSLIEKDEKVIVGVSGGPDSVCLLDILHSISAELSFTIYVSHINHMLRGEESDLDEKYLKEFCQKLGISFYSNTINILEISKNRGISLEEAGREARYNEFNYLADHLKAAKIAVAHNKNDQTETVLMHIIRGTGLEGLRGMDFKRQRIIRPLLNIERKEIEDYCIKNFLYPRTDSSNLENVYTRNRIRLELVPHINRLFETNITESVYKMAQLLKDDNDFIEEAVLNCYNQSVVKFEDNEVALDIELIKMQHPAVRKRIIRLAIEKVKGDLKGIESIHVEDAVELGLNGKTGSEIHLPCSIRVKKSYGVLKVFSNTNAIKSIKFEKKINIPGLTRIDEINGKIEIEIEECKPNFEKLVNSKTNDYEKYFDYEKLYTGINIRSRMIGDIFKPYNSNGTKKLKEYFIDNKVPRDLRDKIPLVAKENEIVWIIGYKISDKFKVTENTKNVIKIKYIK